MTNLVWVQQALQSFLLDGDRQIKKQINQTKTVSKATRIQIYRDAYQARLIEALKANYPCLHTYLGDDLFIEAGLSYLQANPSNFRSIRWFGDKWADYLYAHTDPTLHYLAELAAFEWQISLSFDAADAPILTTAQISQIPMQSWPNLVLVPHPALKKMDCFWNSATLWKALTKHRLPKAPKKHHTAKPFVFWRIDGASQFAALDKAQAIGIDALLTKTGFGELCEKLLAIYPEEAIGDCAASMLKSWIDNQMISEWYVV